MKQNVNSVPYFNLKERLMTYKLIRKELVKDIHRTDESREGICIHFAFLVDPIDKMNGVDEESVDSFNYRAQYAGPKVMKLSFPEFAAHEPEHPDSALGYWWPLSDIHRRIQVMDDCIKKVESKIRENEKRCIGSL